MNRSTETEASIALCLSCTRRDCPGDCEARNRLTADNMLTAARNRNPPGRKTTHFYTVDGITGSLAFWAKQTGILYQTLHYRLGRGMTMAEAIVYNTETDPSPLFSP